MKYARDRPQEALEMKEHFKKQIQMDSCLRAILHEPITVGAHKTGCLKGQLAPYRKVLIVKKLV